MMDCTDRHDRFFLRLMSKNVMLYTEMVATKSAIHGDRKKILSYSPEEKPLALQVGGSNKEELAEVAKIAEGMGYDEININLGCPSKKVQKNMFGACLMKEPDLVAECISAMVNSCKIPVTAKTRIGFDNEERFEYLNNFIHKMRDAGTKTFILHARKAMLTGLSPKQNLNIPKLNYNMVYEIKKQNPELEIIINGGISKIDEINKHLNICDGAMIVRSIYKNTYSLVEIEKERLTKRIRARIDYMLESGAIKEVAKVYKTCWDINLPFSKAIGAQDIISYLNNSISFAKLTQNIEFKTRQFAKRQRTWHRNYMKNWASIDPSKINTSGMEEIVKKVKGSN